MSPAQAPIEDDPEITESGRPRVARPMPDHSSATQCPHCGEEVGMGHYVCWNCSKDIREAGISESQIVDEYRSMQAKEEVDLERRNRAFFLVLVAILLALAAGNLVLEWARLGTSGLFVVLALLPSWWALKASRRIKRIRKAQAQ